MTPNVTNHVNEEEVLANRQASLLLKTKRKPLVY